MRSNRQIHCYRLDEGNTVLAIKLELNRRVVRLVTGLFDHRSISVVVCDTMNL